MNRSIILFCHKESLLKAGPWDLVSAGFRYFYLDTVPSQNEIVVLKCRDGTSEFPGRLRSRYRVSFDHTCTWYSQDYAMTLVDHVWKDILDGVKGGLARQPRSRSHPVSNPCGPRQGGDAGIDIVGFIIEGAKRTPGLWIVRPELLMIIRRWGYMTFPCSSHTSCFWSTVLYVGICISRSRFSMKKVGEYLGRLDWWAKNILLFRWRRVGRFRVCKGHLILSGL